MNGDQKLNGTHPVGSEVVWGPSIGIPDLCGTLRK